MTWFESWFESPWYPRLYHHRTEEEAAEAIELVHHVADLPRGARILDLCCGYGRHASALAEHGYEVTGLDASTLLIERAEHLYSNDHVSFVVGDMRGPYPHAPYDAIVNFFTSFGYFDVHSENAGVIATMHDSVREGGMVVMDFFNARLVRERLVPETVSMIDGVTIIQERRIEEPFVCKTITINEPCQGEYTFEERVWLYSHEELVTMMTNAGLTIIRSCGSYQGAPFDEATSERCIIIAKR
ncbi:class I SAM-dependent methyltransferase [soil metagenome]